MKPSVASLKPHMLAFDLSSPGRFRVHAKTLSHPPCWLLLLLLFYVGPRRADSSERLRLRDDFANIPEQSITLF